MNTSESYRWHGIQHGAGASQLPLGISVRPLPPSLRRWVGGSLGDKPLRPDTLCNEAWDLNNSGDCGPNRNGRDVEPDDIGPLFGVERSRDPSGFLLSLDLLTPFA